VEPAVVGIEQTRIAVVVYHRINFVNVLRRNTERLEVIGLLDVDAGTHNTVDFEPTQPVAVEALDLPLVRKLMNSNDFFGHVEISLDK
jgi:hypothetical protein